MEPFTEPTRTNAPTAESFATAYIKGFSLTIRFLLSKGAKLDIAEEVAQAAWARGWEARHQLLLEDRIVPWVNGIAYHRFCNDRRRVGRQAQLTDITDPQLPKSTAALDASILLGLCNPPDRTLLRQRYLEGMDMREIATQQGLSEVATRVRIHRCKALLRSMLKLPNRVTASELQFA